MTRHLLRLLLVGLGISYGLSASAQTKLSSAQTRLSSSAQTKLSGRILDEQRKGVDAAIVLLITSPDSVLVASTLTDSLGRFSLSTRQGDFVLCIRNLGYKEAKRSLRLEASEQLADIQLEPEAQALDKVVVTARRSRPLTTVTQGKIQIHVVQSYLSDLGSALDVLKHAPGITVSSKGDISLATIGGTALYVNGRKLMLQGEERAAYLRTLSSSKIARIESSPSPNASFGADGAGGIINIILKATEGEGFFLSTSHSAAYWEHLRQSSDLALSYNRSKWQLGFNYSHSIGHHAMDYGYEKLQGGDRSVSTTIDTDKRNTYAAGLDFAWQPSPRSQLSLGSSVSLLAGPGLTETRTELYKGARTPTGILEARNDYVEQQTLRYSQSAQYRYSLSDQQQLSLSADWTHFDGTARCEQPNDYYSPSHTLLRSELFYSQPEKEIDIYALLADYKCAPSARSELLSGLKGSLIKSGNSFVFTRNGRLDPQRSNRFYYDEANLEAYTQYTHSWQRLELSAGIRLEYMHTLGRLRAHSPQGAEEHRSGRLRLFPNLSLSYSFPSGGKLSLLYSRRQDKPRYEDLNPFEYLLDEFSYWKGNPFLRPQTSDKILLSYSLRGLSLSLYYTRLEDYFTGITDALGQDKTVMTTKNLGRQQQAGLEAMYSRRLTSWWDFSTHLGLYYFVNRLDYEHYQQTYQRPSCSLSASNSLLLPLGLNLELSGRYHSARQGGSYELSKPTGSIDLGLNRSWQGGRLRLALLLTDLLHSERWDSYGTKGDLSLASWGNGESRKLILRLSYSLGKQKYPKQEQKLEEVNRL